MSIEWMIALGLLACILAGLFGLLWWCYAQGPRSE